MGAFDNVRVTEYRFNERSFVTLTNQDGCPPCPYAANYINIGLSGKAYNTRARYVRELLFVLKYFGNLDPEINLVQRVRDGKLLSRGEVNGFVSSARFQGESELSNVVSISRHSHKSLENAIHASRVAGAQVKADTAKGRIRRLADFLNFLYQETHSDFVVPDSVSERHKQLQFSLEDEVSALRDFEDKCVGFSESVVPADVFFKLLDIIQPDSEGNPFRHSRLRNYLIVSLFLETGLRRGAIAKLKVEHFKFWGCFDEITVTRSPDDPSDSRAERPHQKTQAHRVFCSPELMRGIKEYIDTTRSRFPMKHDFVFIAETDSKGTAGEPLSLDSYNQLFDKLSNALNFRVYPHLLRHKWNEIFTEKGKEHGVSWEELDKLRKYAMGWVRDSNMTGIYNDFKTAEAVREIQRTLQEQVTSAGVEHE